MQHLNRIAEVDPEVCLSAKSDPNLAQLTLSDDSHYFPSRSGGQGGCKGAAVRVGSGDMGWGNHWYSNVRFNRGSGTVRKIVGLTADGVLCKDSAGSDRDVVTKNIQMSRWRNVCDCPSTNIEVLTMVDDVSKNNGLERQNRVESNSQLEETNNPLTIHHLSHHLLYRKSEFVKKLNSYCMAKLRSVLSEGSSYSQLLSLCTDPNEPKSWLFYLISCSTELDIQPLLNAMESLVSKIILIEAGCRSLNFLIQRQPTSLQ